MVERTVDCLVEKTVDLMADLSVQQMVVQKAEMTVDRLAVM